MLQTIRDKLGNDALTQEVAAGVFDTNTASIRAEMLQRHALLAAQNHAEDIRREIVDTIGEQKIQKKGLESRIRELETTDLELYQWIRDLEGLRYSIWCTRCHQMMSFGDKPADYVENTSAIQRTNPVAPLPPNPHPAAPRVNLTAGSILEFGETINSAAKKLAAAMSAADDDTTAPPTDVDSDEDRDKKFEALLSQRFAEDERIPDL